MKTIPTNTELKAIRAQLKMTPKQLASAIAVPHRTYQGYEQGRPMPAAVVRSIGALLWMDRGTRETWLNYIKKEEQDASQRTQG